MVPRPLPIFVSLKKLPGSGLGKKAIVLLNFLDDILLYRYTTTSSYR